MDLTGVEVISWDVDGTLYSMRKMVASLVGAALVGFVRRGAGQRWRELRRLQQFRRDMRSVRAAGGLLGATGLPEDRAELLELEQLWYGRAIARAGLRSGVAPLMERFRRAGLRQIIVSDYESDFKLRALGLEPEQFAGIYAGESLGYLKPARELFTAVIRDLDIDPAKVLHIGDRADRDGVAASAAGLRTAIVGAEFRSPRHLLAAVTR